MNTERKNDTLHSVTSIHKQLVQMTKVVARILAVREASQHQEGWWYQILNSIAYTYRKKRFQKVSSAVPIGEPICFQVEPF